MVVEKELRRKRKRWFGVHAGAEFSQVKIGESLACECSELVGRVVEVGASVLTGDVKRQGFVAGFRVVKCENEVGHAELVRFQMGQSLVRRLARKGVKKVEDSFEVVSKDNVRFRVKPLLVTRRKTQRSVTSGLHGVMRGFLLEWCKGLDAREVFSSVLGNRVQMELKGAVRKVYPVALSEIRVLERL